MNSFPINFGLILGMFILSAENGLKIFVWRHYVLHFVAVHKQIICQYSEKCVKQITSAMVNQKHISSADLPSLSQSKHSMSMDLNTSNEHKCHTAVNTYLHCVSM